MMNPESLWDLESLSDYELSRRCHRALFSSSRAHWHGPRAELRRRVRNYLRKRRHDRAAMYSILRGVAASSFFALALLGLDVAPARAADPQFQLIPGPVGGFDVGANSAPAFADLDGDGDQDLLTGAYDGTFRYYENVGTASMASFTERTGMANPMDGFINGYYSSPAFADLDNDGDYDLVAGDASGAFFYFENTGSALSPIFTARTGLDNPLDGFSTAGYSSPAFADLDGDADLDVFAGEGSGAILYFENTGSALSPNFTARTGPANPFDGLGAASYSAPAAADLDADGDLDVVVGEYDGTFTYLENTGTSLNAAFTTQTGVGNPLDGFDMGYNATPAFADLDVDSDLDMMAGEYDGTFRLFENTTPVSNPNFTEATGLANPLDGLSAVGGYSAPILADLDNDGDLDVVSGAYDGSFQYFENTGLANAPAYTEQFGSANPFDGLNVVYGSMLALADLDDDGDLDMVAGSYYGGFAYYENTGTAGSPTFVERTGSANPLDGLNVGYSSAPTLVDLDGDGDFDLVSGEGADVGLFLYFENTGTANSPTFVERTGASNPLDGFSTGGFSTPTFLDYDYDGDFDLVAGDDAGVFFYFENTGSALTPMFTQGLGAANPFIGLSPGMSSTLTLGDLNADGSFDIVSGESTGTFVYYVPEPLRWLALTAGSALLGFLDRRKKIRRRRREQGDMLGRGAP